MTSAHVGLFFTFLKTATPEALDPTLGDWASIAGRTRFRSHGWASAGPADPSSFRTDP